jgi:hypothetical protein
MITQHQKIVIGLISALIIGLIIYIIMTKKKNVPYSNTQKVIIATFIIAIFFILFGTMMTGYLGY